MAKRTYKRRPDGKFGTGSGAATKSKGNRATTVKQDPNAHRKVTDDQKKKLNVINGGGTKRKKGLTTKAKVKGRVVKTKQAKNNAARARKRFG